MELGDTRVAQPECCLGVHRFLLRRRPWSRDFVRRGIAFCVVRKVRLGGVRPYPWCDADQVYRPTSVSRRAQQRAISQTPTKTSPVRSGGGAFAHICGHQCIAAVARAELDRGVRCHNPARLIPKLAPDLAFRSTVRTRPVEANLKTEPGSQASDSANRGHKTPRSSNRGDLTPQATRAGT